MVQRQSDELGPVPAIRSSGIDSAGAASAPVAIDDQVQATRVGTGLCVTHRPPAKVECKKCGRHGRYRKATLVEKYGSDIVLFDPCVRAFFAKK